MFKSERHLKHYREIEMRNITERFEYHLKRNNYLVVRYLIDETYIFQEIMPINDSMENQLEQMERRLKESLKAELDNIEMEFNTLIANVTVGDKDLQACIEQTREFKQYK